MMRLVWMATAEWNDSWSGFVRERRRTICIIVPLLWPCSLVTGLMRGGVLMRKCVCSHLKLLRLWNWGSFSCRQFHKDWDLSNGRVLWDFITVVFFRSTTKTHKKQNRLIMESERHLERDRQKESKLQKNEGKKEKKLCSCCSCFFLFF